MAATSIQVPYPVFYDRDGQPLDNGNIYIGIANLDPVTNPLQVYYDDALTIPASQPLKTSGGYIYRNGTPSQLYVNATNFSILVNDEKNLLVYSFPDGTGIQSYTGAQEVEYDPPFAGALTTGYTVADKLEQYVSVKDFGAIGDGVADDTAAFAAAFAASQCVYVPEGVYVASIDLPDGAELYGAGNNWATANSATVIAPPASAAYAVQINGTVGAKNNCKIKNITFANINANAAAPAIYVNSAVVADINDWHSFEDITIRGFLTSIKVRGRLIASTWTRVLCYGGLASDTGLTNIHMDVSTDPSDVSFNANSFQSCFFFGALSNAVKIVGQNVVNKFTTCSFERCNANNVAGVSAVHLEDTRQIEFDGCYFESNGSGVPIDNTTISNNAVDLKFTNGSVTSNHYNAAIKNCWFFGSGISVWIGKGDDPNASPNTYMRGGEINNCLLLPRTNGYAFYSSIAQLNPSDGPFIIDASNQISGKVVVLRDGNKAYPCVARQADAALTFDLTASRSSISPMSRNIVVSPDGSGTNMSFDFLIGGMSFTIHNVSGNSALVMDPAMFYNDGFVISNWTIPPLSSRQYFVEGSYSSPTYKLFETTTQIKTPYAPPIRGCYNRGDIVNVTGLTAGSFVGYAITASGGGAEAARANSTAYSRGQWISIGATVNECITAGITAGSPPATPTAINQLTTDGTVVWKCRSLTTAVAKTYGAITP